MEAPEITSINPVNDVVQQVQSDEDDVDEIWHRFTGEPEIRGVEAARIDDIGGWLVWVMAQDFFCQDRLGAELRQRVASALGSVDRVTSIDSHDIVSWFVTGTPSGEALTRAAAHVVDDLADRLREAMQSA